MNSSAATSLRPPESGAPRYQGSRPNFCGRPPISINIMTPELRNDMRLAYHSHWLEEQRKAQIGGAMTIGFNPLSLLGIVLHKVFPKRKSKKQRERERLQEILDNY